MSTTTRSALVIVLALGAAVSAARPLGAQAPVPGSASDSADDDLINADRPGIADGSRVVGVGQVQLELGAQRERHTDAGSRSTLSFAPTLLRLGVARRLELRIESNTFIRERDVADDGSTERSAGLAPVLFGFKLALLPPSGGDDHLTLGTIVRVAPPSGSHGFNTSHATADLRLSADWDVAPHLSLNPNVGVARYQGSGDDLFTTALGALTLTYAPSPRWSPFVDVGYQSREDSGGSWAMVVDAGLGYIIGRDVQFDASIGTGAHGDSPSRPFVAAGLCVRASPFGRHSTH